MGTRFAAAADVPALAELAAETFPLACPPGTDPDDVADFIATQLNEREFAAHVAQPTRVVLVHEADGGPLDGYVLMIGADEVTPEGGFGVTGARSAYLSKFYVLPGAHGGSVAAPLMEAAKDAAASRLGADSIWLATNVANIRARRFYLKHGFGIVGSKTMQVGSVLMNDDVFELPLL
ncbi:GNAT family N-acetyltransferase [Tessaracoccus terricola]